METVAKRQKRKHAFSVRSFDPLSVWCASSISAEEDNKLDFKTEGGLKMRFPFLMSKTKHSAYDLLISREYDPSDPLEDAHPSRMDSLQQYRLSNFCLVTESFTFMAGTLSFPALDS